MDRKTRHLLTIYGAFHPKSNINRLYLKRKLGGRGLISLKECIESEVRNMQHYIANSEEELLQFVANSMQIDPASVEEKNNSQKRLINQ